ncbi:MAG: hypothetical protein IKW90_09235 [Lachnospiraceae bacterium]|nr:hypothetical protein [Lachnospiraceae bacterium]
MTTLVWIIICIVLFVVIFVITGIVIAIRYLIKKNKEQEQYYKDIHKITEQLDKK